MYIYNIVMTFFRYLKYFPDILLNIFTRYLKDFFTSMIGAPWHWTILSFAASFFFSWFLFAVVWFLVALVHGERQRNIIKPD